MMNIDELKEHFSYDKDTGEITRIKILKGSKRWKTGDKAGSINGGGYAEIRFKNKILQYHRVAWALHYSEQPPEFIDHINTIKTDNRIENLRAATKSQNGANRSVMANNKLGVKGVYQARGQYRASCRVNKKLHHLGYYKTIEEAKKAYNEFASKAFASYARE